MTQFLFTPFAIINVASKPDHNTFKHMKDLSFFFLPQNINPVGHYLMGNRNCLSAVASRKSQAAFKWWPWRGWKEQWKGVPHYFDLVCFFLVIAYNIDFWGEFRWFGIFRWYQTHGTLARVLTYVPAIASWSKIVSLIAFLAAKTT